MTLYTDSDAIKLSMTNFAQSFFLFYDEHNFLAPQNINVVNKLSMLIDIFFGVGVVEKDMQGPRRSIILFSFS